MKIVWLALALLVAYGQTARPSDEEQLRYALSIYVMRLSQVMKGDRSDTSNTFPKGVYGDFARDLYGYARDTYLESRDDEDRLNRHHYHEILGGYDWYSKPGDALTELKAITDICSQTRRHLDKSVERVKTLMSHKATDTSLLVAVKDQAQTQFLNQLKSKGTPVDLWLERRIIVSQLEDMYRFLKEHRGEYDDYGTSPLFLRGSSSLQDQFDKLKSRVDQTGSKITKIMNEIRKLPTVGQMKDALGGFSG